MGPQKGWNAPKIADEAGALADAVEAQPHLRELAHYPLLLTLMAQVHGQDGTLPNDRADLYRRAVALLLSQWENRLVRDREGIRREPGLIQQLRVTSEVLQSALEQVAYEAHRRQETEEGRDERAADIPQWELLKSLKQGLGSLDRAEQAVAYIQERAGLLQARGDEVYTFPHRTFQEYLAALYALKDGEYDTLLANAVRRDPVWWREVFLLAAGASRKHPRVISDMVDALLKREPAMGDSVSEEALERARLAEQALHETGFLAHVTPEQERYQSTAERVRGWLKAALVADDSLPPTGRAAAGVALARLGDERDEVRTVEGMDFCLVPAGPFTMGSVTTKGEAGYDPEARGDESPQQPYDIPYDYWIGRYPVTNAQYAAFVADGGYARGEFWEEARGAGFWEAGFIVREQMLLRDEPRDIRPRNRPDTTGAPFDLPNHPVVGVTWYEALAFTRWLALRGGGAWSVVLPSDPEWEKAARGGHEVPRVPKFASLSALVGGTAPHVAEVQRNPLPTRRYPWEGDLDPNRMNFNETGIGSTSAVGCFPSGASPYGAEEMVGTVWEWSRSAWGSYPYPAEGRALSERESLTLHKGTARVLRGGAFFGGRRAARVASRSSSISPRTRSASSGFAWLSWVVPIPLISDPSGLWTLKGADLQGVGCAPCGGCRGAKPPAAVGHPDFSTPARRSIMADDEMVIFTRTFDFLAWLLPATRDMPRHVRHSYTQRLLDAAFDLRERLEEAQMRRGANRKERLARADEALARARMYLRLGARLEWLSARQYEHAAALLVEIGRLLGGWQKST